MRGKNLSFIKTWQELGIIYTEANVYLYLAQLFLAQEIFLKKVFKDIIRHIW
jgi:hypothetical protein